MLTNIIKPWILIRPPDLPRIQDQSKGSLQKVRAAALFPLLPAPLSMTRLRPPAAVPVPFLPARWGPGSPGQGVAGQGSHVLPPCRATATKTRSRKDPQCARTRLALSESASPAGATRAASPPSHFQAPRSRCDNYKTHHRRAVVFICVPSFQFLLSFLQRQQPSN